MHSMFKPMQWLFLSTTFLLLSACGKFQSARPHVVDKLTTDQRQTILNDLNSGKIHLEGNVAGKNSCKEFIAALPADYTVGFLTVPEDWSQPQGRQVQLFYYGQIKGATNPVIFYNGGPASDSHSSFTNISQLPESRGLNFIYIDQRGTGCSTPFPSDPSLETIQRLKNYGSRSIVKDSERLREKLLGHDRKWKIFGQSYGGLIVHRYATVAPAGITSAHAHGFSVMHDEVEWIKLRMLSQKRVVKDYLKKYPGDDVKVKKLRSLIKPDMCYTAGTTHICGNVTVDALTIFLGFASSWPGMHAVLDVLVQNDTLNLEAYKNFVQNYVLGVFGNQYGPGSVLGWMDMGGDQPQINYCPDVEARLAAAGEHTSEWLINECRLLSAFKDSAWDPLLPTIGSHDPLTLSDIKQTIVNFKIPFYLYSGQLDVFVPYETFIEEIRFLGDVIHYKNFPFSGHEGFLTEPLVWKNLRTE